jgi:hypothetical protein
VTTHVGSGCWDDYAFQICSSINRSTTTSWPAKIGTSGSKEQGADDSKCRRRGGKNHAKCKSRAGVDESKGLGKRRDKKKKKRARKRELREKERERALLARLLEQFEKGQ